MQEMGKIVHTLTIAPKLWPISCATTCHSVLPEVETAVPETKDPPDFNATG